MFSRLTKMLVNIVLGCVFCVCFLAVSTEADAAYSEVTLTNVVDQIVGTDGNMNMSSVQKLFNLGVPDGYTVITYIRGKLMVSGTSSYVSTGVLLAAYYNSNGEQGAGYSPAILYSGAPSKNTWIPFEKTFAPGTQEGNRKLYVRVGGDRYESFYVRVVIDEVRYRLYSFDQKSATVTSEKYVQLSFARTDAQYVPNVWLKVVNVTDNNRIVYQNISLDLSSFNIIDTQVQPEKTYTYDIYAGTGNYTPPVYQFSLSIKVPSDATYAMISAELAAERAWDTSESKSAATLAKEARNAANSAVSNTWDSSESKSAATLAKEARDKANQALTEINNVKNTVNNIQMSVGPQILRVSGRNSATCTKTSSFDVVIQATGATEFRVKADTGSWSEWVPINSTATATGISGIGAHTIYVEARNTSGVTATGQIAIFRI